FSRVRRSPISGLLISIGLIAILTDVFHTIWGPNGQTFPTPVRKVFRLGDVTIGGNRMLVVATAIAVMLLLAGFLRFTRLGKALRATAESPEAAVLMGIPVERIRNLSFAVGAALSGLAGGLLAAVFPVEPSGGEGVLIKGFIVLVLGGAGSPLGAVMAAVLLGIIESLGITYWSSAGADLIAFTMLIVVLFLRPTGLVPVTRDVTL
ncbi:MAG: branched-chain amino acid ABC transporter permease, partial [Acidimicrobiia bacterium]